MVASGTQTLGLRPLGRGHTVSCSGFSSPFFASLYEREPVSQIHDWFLGFLNPPRNCSNLEAVSFNWQYSWLGEQANYITLWLLWFDLFLKFISIAQLQTVQFSSVQSPSHIRLFATPWIAAHQASLSITSSWSLLKLMPIESVMPSSHLILCCPLLLLPPIPPSIRVFSSKSTLRMRWPKYWSFSFSISPSNEHQDWSPLGWTGWISLQSKGLSRVFSNTTVQNHQFFGTQLSRPLGCVNSPDDSSPL